MYAQETSAKSNCEVVQDVDKNSWLQIVENHDFQHRSKKLVWILLRRFLSVVNCELLIPYI